MRDLSLHVLDIAENSTRAAARRVEITICEELTTDRLILMIVDDGKGLELKVKESDPYFTGKEGKRFGLGIPLLAQAARECGGRLELKSAPGKGTSVVAEFARSHIDMKPLGDMGSTMAVLVAGHPEVDFVFTCRRDGGSYVLDTGELRRELDGVPLNAAPVLEVIRRDVNDGIRRLRE